MYNVIVELNFKVTWYSNWQTRHLLAHTTKFYNIVPLLDTRWRLLCTSIVCILLVFSFNVFVRLKESNTRYLRFIMKLEMLKKDMSMARILRTVTCMPFGFCLSR